MVQVPGEHAARQARVVPRARRPAPRPAQHLAAPVARARPAQGGSRCKYRCFVLLEKWNFIGKKECQNKNEIKTSTSYKSCSSQRFIEEAESMLAGPLTPPAQSATSPLTHTPGVIGAQEVYR